jgi:PAS domain S-box-containing protein
LFSVCGEAVDGQDALDKAKELRPDIMVMDITMPRMNGLDATREIKRLLPDTGIVVVSQNETSEMSCQAFDAGARGYVVKDRISTDLLPAITKLNHETCAKGAEPGGKGWITNGQALLDLTAQASLIDLFPMAAYAVRAPDGVIAWFNSRAAELWGRSPIIGDTDERFCGAHKLFYPDGTFMAHCDTPVALALSTGVSVRGQEVVIGRPDGSQIMVLVHIDPIRDDHGSVVGVVNFFDDITERKQAERITGLLAAIVDSSDDAIISKSLDGIITSWNNAAERMFGYTVEEAVGHHITLIIPADHRDEEYEILKRLKAGERIDHFETIRRHKDGRLLEISLTISPVKDSVGKIVGASKVARDITQQKKTEKALLESEVRLRTLADGLESQVRARTEELEHRNTENLQQSEQLRELWNRLQQTQDDERRHIARELHDSAGQIVAALGMKIAGIAQLVVQNPLLANATQESQELVQELGREIRTTSYLLHPPLLDESGISGAIHWYVQGLKERNGLNVDLNISEDFDRLPSEMELALFRIVQESLTNIHRHSGSKTATIRLSRDAESVSLEIQDEGNGLSPEKLARVRAQRSGVGITGMQERVRNLKGAMNIESNGCGTKVSCILPLRMSSSLVPENMCEQTRAAG